ncbi:MAG: winged helix-turn-helix domain-containing protein [Duodenibacillus sp.]|nr:winged helix-turn-helix domain-containing protein [Duodenibacillus sp.]
MTETILIVEDDAAVAAMIAFTCETAGYGTLRAADAGRARELAAQADLVLLDWMLPGMPGIDWLAELRQNPATRSLPVIMLTARGDEADKVAGLEAGADDYVVKPFAPRELIARMRAVLRRQGSVREPEGVIAAGPVRLDEEFLACEVGGRDVRLGVIEFKLLAILAASPGRVWSRSQILERIWGYNEDIDERTVDVHVLRLRKRLAGTAAEDMIETVRGAGYRFARL